MHFFLWLAMVTKTIRVRIPISSTPRRACAAPSKKFSRASTRMVCLLRFFLVLLSDSWKAAGLFLVKKILSNRTARWCLSNRKNHLKIPPSISTYKFERFFKSVPKKFFYFVGLQNFHLLSLCRITRIIGTASWYILQDL